MLRSDNVLEYMSTSFFSFCTSLGVVHQTFCVNTSHQNGVEKKNHILNVARTLLTQMRVPKCNWGHVALTTYYLIKRMPTSILQGESPSSLLYLKGTLFPPTPRVFGCTCFVHVLGPGMISVMQFL